MIHVFHCEAVKCAGVSMRNKVRLALDMPHSIIENRGVRHGVVLPNVNRNAAELEVKRSIIMLTFSTIWIEK
jgi:hypothetical protein